MWHYEKLDTGRENKDVPHQHINYTTLGKSAPQYSHLSLPDTFPFLHLGRFILGVFWSILEALVINVTLRLLAHEY